MQRCCHKSTMIRLFSCLLALLSLVVSCQKDETTIPDMTFRSVDCDMRQAAYIGLQTPGYFMEMKTFPNTNAPIGYAGLLVGSSPLDNQYYAYDSACPVEADRKVAVELVDDNYSGKAACPKCGAQYSLWNGGAPISGSKHSLKHYNVLRVNEFVIRITSN